MKIATWNVNSLKVRAPQVVEWLALNAPDVVALQEIKQTDDAVDCSPFTDAGYHLTTNGQKTYNGVALLTREPATDVRSSIANYDDPQRRFLSVRIGDVRIVNVYVPNGQSLDSPKYDYKLEWLARLRDDLANTLKEAPRLIVLGDFNIAPADADVHDPDAWQGKVLVSDAEREAYNALIDLGLVDVFRNFDQPDRSFSWWDYRAASFRRNRGLRIDLVLASTTLAAVCCASRIDNIPRGWERPSDHAPVLAEFDISQAGANRVTP